MADGDPTKNTRDFFRIVLGATTFGFGFATAVLYSLRGTPAGLTVEFTRGSVIAFAAGAFVAWLYWLVLMRLMRENSSAPSPGAGRVDRRRVYRFGLFSLALAVAAVAAFLYPLRFVPRERLLEIAQGLGLAAVFLAVVGALWWRIKRFLDSDTEPTNKKKPY